MPEARHVQVKFPYTRSYRDRHGKLRVEYRRHGKTVPLRARPGTAEFQTDYDAARALFEGSTEQREDAPALLKPKAATLRWLCVEYFKSAEFEQLAASTQRYRRQMLEAILDEPTHPGSKHVFADFPLTRLDPEHIKVLRDRKRAYPQAANIRVKILRGLFKWAIENSRGGLKRNPARDVPKFKAASDGYHSWTEQEREQFMRRHPAGSKACLAFALLFYTGQRRSDVVLFGRQHVHSGKLRFTQQKNRHRKPVSLELSILPVLQEILDASPLGELTFLVSDHGRPFTVAGFGNWFRERCDEAGLSECSAHGLRKAAAAVAAENGATAHELMSIFGWLTLQEAERYTRAAERKKLAERGMGRLVAIKAGTGSV